MADLDFLSLHPDGNATITVLLPDGTVARIDKLSPTAIADKCPLLFYALDDGPHGDHQASIEASSLDLVASFCRFLYTGSYLTFAEENASVSLLKHVEIYKMARDFDVPELEVSAHVRFLQETEMSCCVPTAPMGLCDTIRFVFKHLADQQPLVDTLLNYCVCSFRYHRLDSDSDFRQVAFDVPQFHKALCQTSFKRDFQDDGAEDIVRLPVCRSNPRAVVLRNADLTVEKRSHAEFQFEEWYDAERNNDKDDQGLCTDRLVLSPKSMAPLQDVAQPVSSPSISPSALSLNIEDVDVEERIVKRRKTITEPDFTLVHRPKHVEEEALFLERDNSSDEEWITVVHRPKQHTQPMIVTPEACASNDSALQVNEDSPIFDLVDIPLSPPPIALDDEAAESDWSLV